VRLVWVPASGVDGGGAVWDRMVYSGVLCSGRRGFSGASLLPCKGTPKGGPCKGPGGSEGLEVGFLV
jgi:hypothetical protein